MPDVRASGTLDRVKAYEDGGSRRHTWLLAGAVLLVLGFLTGGEAGGALLLVGFVVTMPALFAVLMHEQPESVDRPRRPWEGR